MTKRFKHLYLVTTMSAALWTFGGEVLVAQAPSSVRGRVVDQTGLALPDVTVELNHASGVLVVATNDRGDYEFSQVPAGRAVLVFRLINFAAARREIEVATGTTVTADAVLNLSLSADVTVTGRRTFNNLADLEQPAENLVGIALAASQGAVVAAQLETRPIMRAGEVLETVPGVIVSQHSGEGKANQFYLRGFNLDHGTDFASTVAGVPINLPTHGHGHGYSDTNFLIPELVSGVQFKKGPYYAEDGDFSSAGSANINYVNSLDRPMFRVGGGNGDWGRVFGAAAPRLASGTLLAAFEFTHNDGPWDLSEHYLKANGVLRYSQGDSRNGFSITGMAYRGEWDATDQVPLRAIEESSISRFGNIDPTDGGDTHRVSVSAEIQRSRGNSVTKATAFAMHYKLNLFSNFTYFLDNEKDGDQFEQADRRFVSGARLTHRRLGRLGRFGTESAIGVQLRHDAISNVGLYKTKARVRLSTTREDQVGQTSLGGFAQSEIQWSPRFRTLLGLRGDSYWFDVISDNPLNSGNEQDGLVSPKALAVIGPWNGTELYVSGGFGFHSNDARGATITIDPATGDPADRVTPLVRTRGAEIGVRSVRIPGLQTTVALWWLGLDSELLFVGDAGTTEASRPSRRYGVEWNNYARVGSWVTVDFDASFSRSRFTDFDLAGDRIPGAVERVLAGGVSIDPDSRAFGSLRLRYFGPRALIEDNSVRSESTTLVNGEIGYRLSGRARVFVDVFNIFDSKVSDIDYFYSSRLPGEPSGGIDDIHTHPALPRTARLTFQVDF
jgi:hypothetical protein